MVWLVSSSPVRVCALIVRFILLQPAGAKAYSISHRGWLQVCSSCIEGPPASILVRNGQPVIVCDGRCEHSIKCMLAVWVCLFVCFPTVFFFLFVLFLNCFFLFYLLFWRILSSSHHHFSSGGVC